MSIRVYSKPDCVQCAATKRALDKLGLTYEAIDMSENEKALEHAKSLGYIQAPVVFVSDDEHWSGYHPEKIQALAAALKMGV